LNAKVDVEQHISVMTQINALRFDEDLVSNSLMLILLV